MPNIGQVIEEVKLSYIINGMQNGTTTFRKDLQLLVKLNIQLSYDSEILLLNIYQRGMKHIFTKCINENIHSHQKLKTTQMLITR